MRVNYFWVNYPFKESIYISFLYFLKKIILFVHQSLAAFAMSVKSTGNATYLSRY